MKILVLGTVLWMLSFCPYMAKAASCSTLFDRTTSDAVVETQITRPVLYSITKYGRTSFIFGTFPKGISAQALPKVVFQAINRSPIFISDFNPDQDAPPGVFDGETRLTDRVSNSTWKQVKEQFDWASETVHPALPYIRFLETSQLEALGLKEGGNTEMVSELRKYAYAKGSKKVVYLESVGDVIQSYLDSVTPELLEWTLTTASRDELKAVMTQSWTDQARAYREGNISELSRIFEEAHTNLKQAALLESVVKNRNRKWVQLLDERQKGLPFVFAVEAGHLGGESGLIELLAAEGFWIRRVSKLTDLNGPKDPRALPGYEDDSKKGAR